MNLQIIENEALLLPKEDRASLIQTLVLSIDTPSLDELREDWLSEAKCRAKELDDGNVEAVSGISVLEKARALLM